jgi:predicted nucleic acid-binding protein
VSKVFLDTNIFVYAVDLDVPSKMLIAREVIRDIAGRNQGVVSTQILQEMYAVITGKKRVDPIRAKSLVRSLESMEVLTVTPDLIWEAMDCSALSQISFWDALIVVSEQSANCQALLTEDLQPGQIIRGVRIENPFA